MRRVKSRAPWSSEIGAEVRRRRKDLDLTVAELGAAAGISTGMLSKIENGSISPSLAI
jgi:transcriptional regulator with XRE-family HTH domain